MEQLLNDIFSKDTKTKYHAQREVLKLSSTDPDSLYEHFDFFVELLNNSNNIFVWTGLLVLGNLTKVDKEGKIDSVIKLIFAKLNTGKMITAGNSIKALVSIAKFRPDLANEIGAEILKVNKYVYDTQECKNILLGLIFAIIPQIWNGLNINNQKKFVKMAKENINNSRSATSKKATLF